MATRRRFQLETRADVERCLAQSIRQVRKMKRESDPDCWELKRAQVMTRQLQVLAGLMADSGLPDASNEALRAEVRRRAELERTRPAMAVESGGDGSTH